MTVSSGSLYRVILSAIIGLAISAPVFAADKKKDKQSDQAKKVLDQQADIARAMKDKLQNSPEELQKQLDGLKAELSAENDRHNQALAPLQKDLKGFLDAKDKRRADRTQKAIDKENEVFGARSADLNKRIAEVQAKLDAAKKSASK